MKISVVIPTLQAADYLPELLSRLRAQSEGPMEVIIVDSSSSDGTLQIAHQLGCRVQTIPRSEFNHGGTRNLGAQLARGDICVFMTQDALPANTQFVKELVRPLQDGRAVASFARQIAYANARPPEVFARQFNYPPDSQLKRLADVSRLGVKAFFFSNVAAAVDMKAFRSVKGFPESVILNEDMFLCAKLMREGNTVAYCAEAEVLHSHNYDLSDQFRRYFDIGAAFSQNQALISGARAGGEGVQFVIGQIRFLVDVKAWRYIPYALVEAGAKFLAFQLGKHEKHLPIRLKRLLSMHSFFWTQE